MKEDAFRAFVAPRLGARSIKSYLAYARRFEAELGADLDMLDLLEVGLLALADRLRRRGVNPKSLANCLSALRAYRDCDGMILPRQPSRRALAADGGAISPEVQAASIPELLRLQGDLLDELHRRGVVRTGNGLVADLAELLFARAFGWSLEGNNRAGYDAMDGNRKIQIKARRITSRSRSRQLSSFRGLADRRFDTLAAALFDRHYSVMRAVLLPYEIVAAVATKDRWVNGTRLILSDRLWSEPGRGT